MNKVILMGRLARDPDIRFTQGANGMLVARYTLAVDRRGRRDDNGQTADFIGCIAFGKNAEFAEKYLYKGIKILITGRIQTGSYIKEEKRVYTTDIVVDTQEFAESKGSGQGYVQPAPPAASSTAAPAAPSTAAPAAPSTAAPAATSTTAPAADESTFMNIPDGIEEELPFR